MAYGTIKVDTITFTDAGVDKSVTISGLVQNPTFTGNVTVTGTISGNTVRGQTISGVTVTGTTAQFTSGTFVSLTGTTLQGTTATYTTGSFTSLTGTTTSGTTANFVSGVFSTQISGVTVTGTTANFTSGNFTNISGGTHTITSGVFAAGTAANPSISFVSDPNTGIYSPGADQVAISTGGTGRLFVDASGNVGVGTNDTANAFVTLTKQDVSLRLNPVTGAASITAVQTGVAFRDLTIGSNETIFQTASLERMRLDSSGRLGLGTSSPSYRLHAVQASEQTNPESDAGAYWLFQNSSTTLNTCSALSLGTNSDLGTAIVAQRVGANNEHVLKFQARNSSGSLGTRMTLTGSGSLGIGTSSPVGLLDVRGEIKAGPINSINGTTLLSDTYTTGGASLGSLCIERSTGALVLTTNVKQAEDATGYISTNTVNFGKSALKLGSTGLFYATASASVVPIGDSVSLTDRFVITNAGNVGIGTTSPSGRLTIENDAALNEIEFTGSNYTNIYSSTTQGFDIGISNGSSTGPLRFLTANAERARIDSSGRLLVGTSSASGDQLLVVQGYAGVPAGGAEFGLRRGGNPSAADQGLGAISFQNNSGNTGARIEAISSGSWTSGSNHRSYLTFSTTADGASSPTERMRIDSTGKMLVGTTNSSPATSNVAGTRIGEAGQSHASADSVPALIINRKTNDGGLVDFLQDGTFEGSISVSGTTVSYNGAHLSRWSQLPGGAERAEILRGTVLSNIDEMCAWGEEDNEQLNRMKVSDVEGDPNVSGVFQAWDDDDDTYTDDFYCAMTGDFIIRISAGIPVHRGQLLMSAGDGTAKPQDDDIIRSKTMAKVTSNHVTCTYDDGSYCVPCVLMAC